MYKIVPQKGNAGDIISCARSMCGWSQFDLLREAPSSKLTQSTLSRIENGKSDPSINEWVALTSALGITLDSIIHGSIDKISFNNIRQRGKCSILPPKKYLEKTCIKSRALLPLFRYVEEKLDEKSIQNFFEGIGVNRLYFFCLDNEVNLQFVSDFVKRIMIELMDTGIDGLVRDISKNIQQSFCHGILSSKYPLTLTPTQKIQKFVELEKEYQSIFQQSISNVNDNVLTIKTTVNPAYEHALERMPHNVSMIIEELIKSYAKEMSYFGLAPKARSHKIKINDEIFISRFNVKTTIKIVS